MEVAKSKKLFCRSSLVAVPAKTVLMFIVGFNFGYQFELSFCLLLGFRGENKRLI